MAFGDDDDDAMLTERDVRLNSLAILHAVSTQTSSPENFRPLFGEF
jgi:hypothetical protein